VIHTVLDAPAGRTVPAFRGSLFIVGPGCLLKRFFCFCIKKVRADAARYGNYESTEAIERGTRLYKSLDRVGSRRRAQPPEGTPSVWLYFIGAAVNDASAPVRKGESQLDAATPDLDDFGLTRAAPADGYHVAD
jgi:hypothetical protein